MNRKLIFIVFNFILLGITGCTAQVNPSTVESLGSEQVFERNYTIGDIHFANVGQPIIKLKEYKVNKYRSNRMQASHDFVISGGVVSFSGKKDVDYVIRGDTVVGGEKFTVLDIPSDLNNTYYGVLIRSDGSIHSTVLSRNIKIMYSFSSEPKSLFFTKIKSDEVIVDSGSLNFELIYGGTDGKSIFVTFREFTGDDLARPSFYQNLVYRTGTKKIRFKDIVLSIDEVSNEKIVYSVLSDGLVH